MSGSAKTIYVPLAALVMAGCLLVRGQDFRETMRYSLQGLALSVLFVAAIRFYRHAPFRLLNLRPVVLVGLVSYSLYLIHYSVIAALQVSLPAVHPLVRALLSLVLSLALSWLMYVFVERPCARLRRKLSD